MTEAEVQAYWLAHVHTTDTFRPTSWVMNDDDWTAGWE